MRRRALVLATLIVVLSSVASGQEPRILHIKVTLTDAARASVPVARHPLLISDNPATSTPRRVVTAADGTADVRLRPGNYTVESDEPFAFNGKGYQWTQTLDIPAGRDVVLELTSRNAEIVAAPVPSPSSSAAPIENDSSLLLPQWQDSVVSIWTPESRASGFLVDAAGLVVTDQRSIGSASAVEVQLTPSVKVGARVLAADRARDVAVLWIDPATAAAVRPVPLHCADGAKPPVVDRDRLVALGAPLHGPKELFLGNAGSFRLEPDSTGGPVFSSGGSVVGMSSVVDEQDDRRRRDARVVSVADVCAVVASAEKARQTAPRPVATRLPVEPVRSVSASEGLSAAVDAAAQRRTGNLSAYQMSSADFDIAFLTPVMVYAAQHKTSQTTQQTSQQTTLGSQVAVTDFGSWSDYFTDVPPVLVVRVTPKQTESFWTTVARGAAYTQGAAIPAIKHFKPGFARLHAWCGDTEVTPIHPFTLERRVSETDAVREGLYVFDPQSLGPHCASVKFILSSEKDPNKQDNRMVDPHMIERIWQDF